MTLRTKHINETRITKLNKETRIKLNKEGYLYTPDLEMPRFNINCKKKKK
jgi:hypothetical protein